MTRYVIAYAGCLFVLLILDATWLSWATGALYKPQMGDLLTAQPRWGAAALFYLLYAVGVSFLIVIPALNSGSVSTALISGAIFGVVAYGTYDLTNLATLQGWSIKVTVFDMIWGGILTAAASAAGFLITERWG